MRRQFSQQMKNEFRFLFLGFLILKSFVVVGQFSNGIESTPVFTSSYSVKTIKLPSGVELEYVEKGVTSGTPVIFLHGYSDSWHSFDQVLPLLPSSVHAFSISQRGHGNSDRPEKGYAPEDFASDLADFMQELNLKPAIIVGHSMGATVAQRFALDYPYMAQAMVLVGSFASFKSNAGIVELQKMVSELKDPVDSGFVHEFQSSTIFKPISPLALRTYVNESRKIPSRVWKAVAKELLTVDYSKALTGLAVPVLIVWGEKDNFCPASDQEVLAKAIKRSKLIVYERIGHAVHWEDPERFTADLLEFINTLNGLNVTTSSVELKEMNFLTSFY